MALAMLVGGLAAATASAHQSPTGALAFVDVSVLPMDSERLLPRHTVVVLGDRIIAVEPSGDASLPDGATVVEGRGKYLIPGLIDAHARLLSDDLISDRHLAEELAAMVSNGITTARHAAGSAELLRRRQRVVADDLLSPILHVSSPEIASLEPAAGFTGFTARTAFEAAAEVRRFRQAGYDFVSLAFGNTADIYQGIVLTARGSRSPLIGRVPAAVGLRRALESGQHIEYLDGFLEAASKGNETAKDDETAPALSSDGVRDSGNWHLLDDIDDDRLRETVRLTADAEVWSIPLLFTLQAALEAPATPAEASPFVGQAAVDEIARRVAPLRAGLPGAAERRRYLRFRDRIVAELHDASSKLLAGSGDPLFVPPYGEGLHHELRSMVAAGMPPFAALEAATRRAAEFLSFRGGGRTEFATVDAEGMRFQISPTSNVDFGRVEVGMRADLVLLGSNPLDDIGAVGNIEGVVLRGRWLPRAELDAIRDRAAQTLRRATLR